MNNLFAFYVLPETEKIVAVCPHCENYHIFPKDTPKGVEMVAECNPLKKYVLTDVLKPRSVLSALKNRAYDLNRKKKDYVEIKETQRRQREALMAKGD